jgi:hypothetical protein
MLEKPESGLVLAFDIVGCGPPQPPMLDSPVRPGRGVCVCRTRSSPRPLRRAAGCGPDRRVAPRPGPSLRRAAAAPPSQSACAELGRLVAAQGVIQRRFRPAAGRALAGSDGAAPAGQARWPPAEWQAARDRPRARSSQRRRCGTTRLKFLSAFRTHEIDREEFGRVCDRRAGSVRASGSGPVSESVLNQTNIGSGRGLPRRSAIRRSVQKPPTSACRIGDSLKTRGVFLVVKVE